MKAIFVLLSCVMATATAARAEDPIQAEQDRLQGKWRCVKLATDGREGGLIPERPLMIFFTQDKVAFGQADGKGEVPTGQPVAFKLDIATTPRQIDIGGEKGLKGIYSVDGKKLILMHPLMKNGEDGSKRSRPEKLEPKAGDRSVYMELEKAI